MCIRDSLDTALRRLTAGEADAMKAAARATAMRYSLEREERAVLDFWQSFLAA